MLSLPFVTLFCVETRDPVLAEWAIQRCMQRVSFARVVLVTNLALLKERRPEIEYFQAPPISNVTDYSKFMLSSTLPFVIGTHALVIQWDSFITNPKLWQEEFLEYDYIGSVWQHHPESPVGNGGFSLRSVKLLKALQDPNIVKKNPEDYCICVENKKMLEQKYLIQFAPIHIAEQFAIERTAWHEAFGFHGLFNFGRVLRDHELIEFIKIMPDQYLGGLDTYDLIDYLRTEEKFDIASMIIKKLPFRWKKRRQYLLEKIRNLLFKLKI